MVVVVVVVEVVLITGVISRLTRSSLYYQDLFGFESTMPKGERYPYHRGG